MTALPDQVPKLASQCRVVCDLALDFREVLVGDDVYRVAILLSVVGQVEQSAHLLEREAEVARPPDEAQATQMRGPVGPIVARGARRRGQQADPLVVADRLHLGSRRS